jgi:hypothetical protein
MAACRQSELTHRGVPSCSSSLWREGSDRSAPCVTLQQSLAAHWKRYRTTVPFLGSHMARCSSVKP